MRVALETNALYTTRAGIARYVRGLVAGFQRCAPPDVEVVPFAWEVENFIYRQPGRMLKTAYRELVWAKFQAPRLLRKMEAQLLHSTHLPLVRPPGRTKEVITLHDLAMLRHPERFRPWHRNSARYRLSHLRAADRVICVSRFTADEAMSLLGLSPARLVVIYNGCDFHPDSNPVAAEPGFPVPSEFFLFVGSLEPGKNLALLKQVYALARSSQVNLPPLMIVGVRWAGVAAEGEAPLGWHYLGHQPDEVLIYLYRKALALVFPSEYEGFGLPVVEAMTLGCPVICSPVASLPEVGGDAVCFAPMSPQDYLNALLRLSSDSRWREELISKGRVQAARFSWSRCAQQVLDVYRGVWGEGGSFKLDKS